MAKSKIEWTESTWNPVTGCTKISSGCLNCYAERMAKRLKAMKIASYKNGFDVTLHPEPSTMYKPLQWKVPQMIFVNSMSDLFHDKVPLEFIQRIFSVMNKAPWHTYQILTKRAERLAELSDSLIWKPHIWMGVTVEGGDFKHRIDNLRNTQAHVKFLSMEPLIDSVGILDLHDIDWVIVGGESGPGARTMKKEWVIEIQQQCIEQNVPFFFKQWGGINKKRTGRVLDGRTWDEMPEVHAIH
jgi:protein gp37